MATNPFAENRVFEHQSLIQWMDKYNDMLDHLEYVIGDEPLEIPDTTDDLPEGLSNYYYTNERVSGYLEALGLIDAEGNFTFDLTSIDTHIIPGENGTYDIGSEALSWGNIYAQEFHDSSNANSNSSNWFTAWRAHPTNLTITKNSDGHNLDKLTLFRHNLSNLQADLTHTHNPSDIEGLSTTITNVVNPIVTDLSRFDRVKRSATPAWVVNYGVPVSGGDEIVASGSSNLNISSSGAIATVVRINANTGEKHLHFMSKRVAPGTGLELGSHMSHDHNWSNVDMFNISKNTPISTSTGALWYNGHTNESGVFYGGTSNPTHSSRLNYDGHFYATKVYSEGHEVATLEDLESYSSITYTAGTGLLLNRANQFTLQPISSGSSNIGALNYNGTTKSAGKLYGGTSNPTNTTRLNYDGNLHVNEAFGQDFNALSDIRLKKDIKPIDKRECLNTVLSLTPSSFIWKETGSKDTGLIAQEVQEILPERVTCNETLSVSYGKLTTHLIGAVQEQQNQINELSQHVLQQSVTIAKQQEQISYLLSKLQ